MKIGFWLTTPQQFDPQDIDNALFGGAERSALNLAKKLKHDVVIFGNIEESHSNYFPYSALRSDELDVLICVRADQNLLNPRRNHIYFREKPKKVILWTGDAWDQPNNQIFHDKHSLDVIDLIVTKSHWQREGLIRYYPLLTEDKVTVMYNGVDIDWIPEKKTVNEPKFVYASTAYRGMNHFILLWPKIKSMIPEATLDCYCKTTLYIKDNPRDREWHWLYDLINEMDGSRICEPVPQKELLGKLGSYYAMLYPNDNFWESSCGVALESMACGTPVIASARGGLIETLDMGRGYPIEGDPDTKNYENSFLDTVEYIWERKIRAEERALKGREEILNNYSWDKVAKRWEAIFQESSLESSPVRV